MMFWVKLYRHSLEINENKEGRGIKLEESGDLVKLMVHE